MTIKLGSYSVLINPIHEDKVKTISSEEIDNLELNLDRLVGIVNGDFEWVLTGGLAIPTTLGKFYRTHRDIDIGLNENDLEFLVKTIRENGYDLFSRRIMVKLSSKYKLDVYKSVSVEEVLAERCKHLRAVRLNNKKIVRHISLLDYFDVYLHHYEDEKLVSNDGKIKIPILDSFGRVYVTCSGKEIRIRSLRYIEQLKRQGKDKIDKYDLEVIKQRL